MADANGNPGGSGGKRRKRKRPLKKNRDPNQKGATGNGQQTPNLDASAVPKPDDISTPADAKTPGELSPGTVAAASVLVSAGEGDDPNRDHLRGNLRTLENVIRKRWKIDPRLFDQLPGAAGLIALDKKKYNTRERLAAMRLIATMNRQNQTDDHHAVPLQPMTGAVVAVQIILPDNGRGDTLNPPITIEHQPHPNGGKQDG